MGADATRHEPSPHIPICKEETHQNQRKQQQALHLTYSTSRTYLGTSDKMKLLNASVVLVLALQPIMSVAWIHPSPGIGLNSCRPLCTPRGRFNFPSMPKPRPHGTSLTTSVDAVEGDPPSSGIWSKVGSTKQSCAVEFHWMLTINCLSIGSSKPLSLNPMKGRS